METALALQRAPGERFRLRERPLPAGVIHLIEVAAASPQALQGAAAELGEREPVLLEAARFYLEQVLLADPDADAYRVLGVAPDVPHDTIRTHHRWLQRWLHPDRAQAGDASVFAMRVNQAFAQVRTPELRHGYDVRLAEARMAGATAPIATETLRRWEQGDELLVPGVGRRSRWLLAVAALSCAVLAVLIVRNPQNAVAWEESGAAARVQALDAHTAPAIEDRDLGVLSAALSMRPATPEPLQAPQVVPVDPAPQMPAPIMMRPVATLHRQERTVPAAFKPASPNQSVPVAEPVPAAMHVPIEAATMRENLAPGPMPEPDLADRRMRLAEQRADQVVAYLGDRPGVFPLWNDPGVEEQASQFRGVLNARSGSFVLTGAEWALGTDSASLAAAYRCRTASRGKCEGRLMVDLVWREGFWFVRRISLAPPA